ncbi:DUF402 domain-containing protein [Arthrobacter sp. R4-81]
MTLHERIPPDSVQRGDLVVARNRKWDGGAHWVVPGTYLGEDPHGWWIFQPAGSFCSRPGAAFHAQSDAVLLVPRAGEYVATFYDDTYPGDFRVYVDLALEHGWTSIRPGTVEFHVIDMDLDVIRSTKRGVYVDDEDEFDEHRVRMDYPADVVELLLRETEQLYQAVKAHHAPFDGSAVEWFKKGRA